MIIFTQIIRLMDYIQILQSRTIDEFASDYEHGKVELWYDYTMMVAHHTAKSFKSSIDSDILNDIVISAAGDAVIKAYIKRDTFDSSRNAKVTAWLWGITANCTKDGLKKRKRISVNEDVDSPSVIKGDNNKTRPVIDIIREQAMDYRHEVLNKCLDAIDHLKMEDKLIIICLLDNKNNYVAKARQMLVEIKSPLAASTDSAIKARASRARVKIVERIGVDAADLFDGISTDYSRRDGEVSSYKSESRFNEEDLLWFKDRMVEYVFVSLG